MLETATGLEALLDSVVARVLETMFFSIVLESGPVDGLAGWPREAPGVLAAALTFRGTPSGALSLVIDEAAMRPLAAGFLGEDAEAIAARQVGEMACELANMLCGAMVSTLETRMSFELASPGLVTPEEALAVRAGAGVRRSFALEDGTLTVVLHLAGVPHLAGDERA